jgi:nucleoside diphosphate kinase
METYLSKRMKRPSRKHSKKAVKESTDAEEFKTEEHEYYSEGKSFFQKLIDFIAGSEEEISPKDLKKKELEEEEKELCQYPKQKTGLLATIKSWFFVEDKHEEVVPDEKIETPVIDEDLKDVLKRLNKWLTKLPKKTITKFKNSEDYKIYKETLKKYNLIKVKED